MYDRPPAIEQTLAELAAAPPRIAELIGGVAPSRLRAAPDDGGWSANDVLAHLRACADVWGGCIAKIIAEDKPTLRHVSPRSWIRRTNYPDLDFQPSLHAFTSQRADLLALLERLPHDDWSRAATVTGAGKVFERTALAYAQGLTTHERSHLQQIECIVDEMRP